MTIWLIGARFGPYELDRRLGGGGFGDVWLAHTMDNAAPVALKILRGEYQSASMAKLRAEIELLAAAASSRSPNIVTVLGGGSDPAPHVVMEYIDGTDLGSEIRRRGPLPPEDVLDIADAIADALASLQQAGIIHRDLKPANVMIDKNGAVKLTDFGIAKIVGLDTITATNDMPMSMAYAAPEVWQGRASYLSDHYSFGALLYCCLVGRPPFTGGYVEIYNQHLNAPPDLSPLPEITPLALRQLIGECLEKDASLRPRSAEAVRVKLAHARTELSALDDATVVIRKLDSPRMFGPWVIDARLDEADWTFACHHEDTGESAVVQIHFSDELSYGQELRHEVASSPEGREGLLSTSRLVLRPGEGWTDAPEAQFLFWLARIDRSDDTILQTVDLAEDSATDLLVPLEVETPDDFENASISTTAMGSRTNEADSEQDSETIRTQGSQVSDVIRTGALVDDQEIELVPSPESRNELEDPDLPDGVSPQTRALDQAGEALDVENAASEVESSGVVLELRRLRKRRIWSQSHRYELGVSNQSHDTKRLQIRVEDSSSSLSVGAAQEVTVPANSIVTVPLLIQPHHSRWIGRQKTVDFSVLASEGDAGGLLRADGRFQVAPRLGLRLTSASLIGIGGILAMLIVLGLHAKDAAVPELEEAEVANTPTQSVPASTSGVPLVATTAVAPQVAISVPLPEFSCSVPRTSTLSVNVRSGPDSSYPLLAASGLQAGDQFTIDGWSRPVNIDRNQAPRTAAAWFKGTVSKSSLKGWVISQPDTPSNNYECNFSLNDAWPFQDYTSPMFVDDFSDPRRSLFQANSTIPASQIEMQIVDGEMLVKANSWTKGGTFRHWLGPTVTASRGFAVEFDLRRTGGTQTPSFGLLFKDPALKYFSIKLIPVGGRVVAYAGQNNQAGPPLSMGENQFIKQDQNHVRLEVRGTELKTVVNGGLINTISNPLLAERPMQLRLVIWTDVDLSPSNPLRLYFDNFFVFELP